VLASIATWAWFGPAVLRKLILVEVHGPNTREWAIDWTRAADGSRHGAYAELDDHQPQVVEITVEPRPDAPTEPFEFWLYQLKTDADTRFDLVGLTDHNAAPGWIPNENGPGIIYQGPALGKLTIPVDTRTIAVAVAKTKRGGKVTLRFRGEVVDLPAFAVQNSSDTIVIPWTSRTPPAGTLARRLPTYDTTDATLSWTAPTGDVAKFTNPRLTFAIANKWLFSRPATLEPVTDVQPAGDGAFTATGPRPSIRFNVNDAPGPIAFILGSAATFIALSAFTSFLYLLARLVPLVAASRHAPAIVVAALVLTTHIIVATVIPVFVTSDGIDYMDSADVLAQHGSFDRFPDYKAPGISIVIAAAMRLSDRFLDAFGWIMAAFAVGTSLMAYVFVRARSTHAWALAAALIVGLHPSLITYETFLLRELPSAAVMMGVALAIVMLRDRLQKGESIPWRWTVPLALLCAAGALLRENLQVLVFLVPLLLLIPGAGLLRRRAIAAAAVGVLSAGIILPGVVGIHKVHGNISLVRPKIHYNRTLASQGNRTHDANFTEILTREQWLTYRNEHLKRGWFDGEWMALLHRSALAPKPSDPPSKLEQSLGDLVDEAAAREPLSFYKSSLRAFISQLGLWNVQTGSMKDVAPSDQYYSRALRGETVPAATNFPPDTVTAVNNSRHRERRDRLLSLVANNRRSIKFLEDRPLTRFFNEWFFASRAFRPIAACLFLVAFGFAIYKRDIALVAVGVIVLLSTLAAAIVVGTPTDRFGVPFIPIVWCMALLALRQLILWRRSRVNPAASEIPQHAP